MAEPDEKRINWPLLLPIGLLMVEIIAVIVMLALNTTITQYLFFFLLLLSLFLIYQIAKQLIMNHRLTKMVAEMAAAEELADTGKPMEAVKAWKKLLPALPREAYLEVLDQLEDTYMQMEMSKAAKQVKTIHSESIEFFNATENVRRMNMQDRQTLQARLNAIRAMILALPEEEN